MQGRKMRELPSRYPSEITMLEERCRQYVARIEALEAALRKIAEWPPSSRIDDIINAFIDAKLYARAALAKDDEK
jgi:hypothetical protein